jgi:nicotinate-nucleotide adenylyltransferase
MRLGIFGGSFDPIHVGHLIVAQEALHRAELDRLLVLPTARPPHKPSRELARIADRLAMVRLAIAGTPGLEAAETEAHGGTAYTVDTLRWARAVHGAGAELFLVIGEDSLAELPTWREPEEILRLATLLVYPRRGAEGGGTRYPHVDLLGDTIDISSSTLRRRIREGAPIRFWVPDAVRLYIEAHGLYRGGPPC